MGDGRVEEFYVEEMWKVVYSSEETRSFARSGTKYERVGEKGKEKGHRGHVQDRNVIDGEHWKM